MIIDYQWCKEHRACYYDLTLQELFPVGRTIQEVLVLKDGPWFSVPWKDRIWVAQQVLGELGCRKMLIAYATLSLTPESPPLWWEVLECANLALKRLKTEDELREMYRLAEASKVPEHIKECCWPNAVVSFAVVFHYMELDGKDTAPTLELLLKEFNS